MVFLVDQSVKASQDLSQDTLYTEVLQHLHMMMSRCDVFRGRGDLLKTTMNRVLSGSQYPVVIYGDSGSGKTSVMAMTAKQVGVEIIFDFICFFKTLGIVVIIISCTTEERLPYLA